MSRTHYTFTVGITVKDEDRLDGLSQDDVVEIAQSLAEVAIRDWNAISQYLDGEVIVG